jgi:hypothetical protein
VYVAVLSGKAYVDHQKALLGNLADGFIFDERACRLTETFFVSEKDGLMVHRRVEDKQKMKFPIEGMEVGWSISNDHSTIAYRDHGMGSLKVPEELQGVAREE